VLAVCRRIPSFDLTNRRTPIITTARESEAQQTPDEENNVQIPLIPIQLIDEQPTDRIGTKDLLWTGSDEQNRRYALKTVEPNNKLLPLTEWLCYHLCGAAGILTPEFSVVTRIDGTPAFGSRWETEARQFSPARISDAEFTTWIAQTKADISGMFALDVFMPNVDRHFANILFVDTGARLRALAFDWSRTLLFQPWPWPADCKSERSWNWLCTTGLQDVSTAENKLSRLREMTGEKILQILRAAPDFWRQDFDIDSAALWWDANKDLRIEQALRLLKP